MTKSERLKERWKNPEYREKMSKQSKNLWKDENYKIKTTAIYETEEYKKRISERFKDVKKSDATKIKMKKNNGNNKKIKIDDIEYISINEASRFLNESYSQIRGRLYSKYFTNYIYLDGTNVTEFSDKNISARKYKENNREKIKEYYEKNKEKEKEYRKLNSEKIKKYQKEYYGKNKENIRKKKRVYVQKRRKNDKLYNLQTRIRGLIRESLRRKGYTKKSRTFEILGCPYIEFMKHLECKFEPWMNWDNYGKYNGELDYGWNIDHIIPNSSGKSEDEILKLNHFSNLQPLCSKINRDIKKDKRDY